MAKDRKPSQEERDRRRIGQMYLQGMIQADIAKELGISQPTVSREIKLLVDEWRKERVLDINEAKRRELAKVDNLELEYWDAWKRSQAPGVTETTGRGQQGKIDTIKTEYQVGDPRFLAGVMSCIEKRCAILGLEAPKRVEGTGDNNEILFRVIHDDVARIQSPSGTEVPPKATRGHK